MVQTFKKAKIWLIASLITSLLALLLLLLISNPTYKSNASTNPNHKIELSLTYGDCNTPEAKTYIQVKQSGDAYIISTDENGQTGKEKYFKINKKEFQKATIDILSLTPESLPPILLPPDNTISLSNECSKLELTINNQPTITINETQSINKRYFRIKQIIKKLTPK